MTTWVLVAHRAGARLFVQNGKQLDVIRTLENPDGRSRDRDFESDRPGRGYSAPGQGGHAMSGGSPHERNAVQFAEQVAEMLGTAPSAVNRIVLVAEPHFLGLLRAALNPRTAALATATVPKDLGRIADRDVAAHLNSVLG